MEERTKRERERESKNVCIYKSGGQGREGGRERAQSRRVYTRAGGCSRDTYARPYRHEQPSERARVRKSAAAAAVARIVYSIYA